MLTHVVMMKLVDRADTTRAKELLDGLAGRVPTLRSVTVGVDTLAATPNSWDLMLMTTHDDADGLRSYQAHDAHQEVVGWLGSRIATLRCMDEPPRTYSISVRLQRTTTEETYLSVPVDQAVMQDEPAADGSYRIDPGKLSAEAIRLADQSTDWRIEDRQVTPHPIQQAPPWIAEA